ncbi:hypothetical protein PMZ80_003247 [Knufia obscura]|uniref:Uncharacterized protein n=2 Tax=Knufia TaxID=430999 RepID=A0AAN8EA76_9EURO|nr:hypothetical protein PMZ80_003247 [Knufia obscura]KAK5950364.1 hypothetical protein OHC33_008583 [Knufia fluminis]
MASQTFAKVNADVRQRQLLQGTSYNGVKRVPYELPADRPEVFEGFYYNIVSCPNEETRRRYIAEITETEAGTIESPGHLHRNNKNNCEYQRKEYKVLAVFAGMAAFSGRFSQYQCPDTGAILKVGGACIIQLKPPCDDVPVAVAQDGQESLVHLCKGMMFYLLGGGQLYGVWDGSLQAYNAREPRHPPSWVEAGMNRWEALVSSDRREVATQQERRETWEASLRTTLQRQRLQPQMRLPQQVYASLPARQANISQRSTNHAARFVGQQHMPVPPQAQQNAVSRMMQPEHSLHQPMPSSHPVAFHHGGLVGAPTISAPQQQQQQPRKRPAPVERAGTKSDGPQRANPVELQRRKIQVLGLSAREEPEKGFSPISLDVTLCPNFLDEDFCNFRGTGITLSPQGDKQPNTKPKKFGANEPQLDVELDVPAEPAQEGLPPLIGEEWDKFTTCFLGSQSEFNPGWGFDSMSAEDVSLMSRYALQLEYALEETGSG